MKTKKELIAQRDPKSPISEIFRTLRTNIQFMSTNKKLKTLLVTSTYPGEGKSWISSNLAVTFAQAGNRVILIDADMRKGRQYVIFGTSPRPGLSNCLSEMNLEDSETFDITNYIQKTEVENLLMMSAGNVPPNPSELLVSDQMVKLLEELKEVCDLIIIDGTPCELVTDSVILSRVADSTLIVTAHKETKKDSLDRVIKSIQNVGGKLAGVVINKMPVSVKRYNEKYYYYGGERRSSIDNNTKKDKNVYGIDLKSKENEKIMQNKENNSYTINKENINKEESLDKPNFYLNNENNVISVEKTNNILEQINSYLDKEKNNFND